MKHSKILGHSATESIISKNAPSSSHGTDLYKVVEAGGGVGRDRLHFSALQQGQLDMFRRTLVDAPIIQANRDQEIRQKSMVDKYKYFTVNIAREDFLEIAANIEVKYQTTASQAAWAVFITDVSKRLGLEFLESIHERKDGSPVYCTTRLRPGGHYLVRQREASSILETLYTGKTPDYSHWPVVKKITKAKDDLGFREKMRPDLDNRVDNILSKPTIRRSEKITKDALMSATTAGEMMQALAEVIESDYLKPMPQTDVLLGTTNSEDASVSVNFEPVMNLSMDLGSDVSIPSLQLQYLGTERGANLVLPERVKPIDKEVDVINLHRLCFECLSRLALKDEAVAARVASVAARFIIGSITALIVEVDIVILGLKLLNELLPQMTNYRYSLFEVVLNCIQAYSPPSSPNRRVEEPARIGALARLMGRVAGTEEALLAEQQREEERRVKEKADALAAAAAEAAAVEAAFEAKRLVEEAARLAAEEEVRLHGRSKKKRALREQRAAAAAAAAAMAAQEEPAKKGWSGSTGALGKKKAAVETGGFGRAEENEEVHEEEAAKLASIAETIEKLQIKPLPIVPGVTFRGFRGQTKRNMGLLQSFATLYKFVAFAHSWRDLCFRIFVLEEICEIALGCQGQPRVLEYVIWIINALYADGFRGDDEEDDVESSAFTMVVSGDSRQRPLVQGMDEASLGSGGPGGGGESVDPLTGMVINAVSTITMPSIHSAKPGGGRGGDNDHLFDDDDEVDPVKLQLVDRASKAALVGSMTSRIKPKPSPEYIQEFGVDFFERRFLAVPADNVVLATALISAHIDLDQRDRDTATRWLNCWDDFSRKYSMLRRKGVEMSGL